MTTFFPATYHASVGGLLAVIRNRNVAILLSGGLVSSTGDWLYAVALSIAVYHYSHGDTLMVGLLWLIRFVPYLLVSTFAGRVATLLGYRRAMITADLSRMVLVAIMAPLLNQTTWTAIFPLVFLVTALGALYRPASVAIIPSLVPSRDMLLTTNATLMQADNIAAIVGSLLGGIIASAGAIAPLFLIEAATFGVSALSLSLLRIKAKPATTEAEEEASAEAPARSGFWAGVRAVLSRPVLIFALGAMLLPEFESGADIVWVVPYSSHVLHLGNAGIGYLFSALGVGSILGSLVAATLGSSGRLDLLLAGSTALGGLSLALFGATSFVLVALVAFALVGTMETIELAAYDTLLQDSVPEELIGQAVGTMDSLMMVAMLIGSVASGPLVRFPGLRPSLIGLGLLIVPASGLAYWYFRRDTAGRPSVQTLAEIPVFAALPPPAREWAVRRMVKEEFPTGRVLVRQGEEGDMFYAIAQGQVEVESTSDGHVQKSVLGPGEVFGEIALLHNVPRTATVKAIEPLTVYALSREDFHELEKQAGEFRESLLQTAASRLDRDPNLRLALATRT